jgi:hypothetical protein
MTAYALRRGQQWLCLASPVINGLVPEAFELSDRADRAWVASTVDEAIERQQLLRIAFGIATEVRALR